MNKINFQPKVIKKDQEGGNIWDVNKIIMMMMMIIIIIKCRVG